jgi:hypothetical protein
MQYSFKIVLQVRHTLMLHHNSLGLACGAGGIDAVCQIPRALGRRKGRVLSLI